VRPRSVTVSKALQRGQGSYSARIIYYIYNIALATIADHINCMPPKSRLVLKGNCIHVASLMFDGLS